MIDEVIEDPRRGSVSLSRQWIGARRILEGGLLLTALALMVQLGSPTLLEDPNEGQYAEVAREMLVRGDWISPHLNGVVFLNKPPLLYWLIAAMFSLHRVCEAAARLPSVLMTLLAVILVYGLGRELFDATTGLVAAAVYVATPSILIEARLVRPDAVLTVAVTATLLAFVVALRTTGPAQRRALYGLQLAVAAGLLAKGVIAILLPAIPMTVIVIAERRFDFVRRLLVPRSWMLLALVVLPWHVAVAWRHPGFAWDYLVNQHVLFFFDRKLPRDSIPISLTAFWGAFAARLFPWTLLLPVAVIRAALLARADSAVRFGALLLVTWLLGTMAFFSAAVSRLEHYSLPALPAAALLIAVLLRRLDRAPGWRAVVAAYLALLLIVFVASRWFVLDLIGSVEWVRDVPAVVRIGRAIAFLYILATAAAVFALRWSAPAAAACLTAAALAAHPIVHRSLIAIAPLNSSAPTAQIVARASEPDTRVVFEAPTEYQHVAGLAFYLRESVLLLRPDDFVEPTYLIPHRDRLFIDREVLAELWRQQHVIFVSDPLAPADRSLDVVVPQPFFIVARVGNRWVLSNRPVQLAAGVQPGDGCYRCQASNTSLERSAIKRLNG